jgi:hypothetical protein
MRRRKLLPRTTPEIPERPFTSAEESWFWFVRCSRLRQAGARLAGTSEWSRPCSPDDIYRTVADLYRRKLLNRRQLQVLSHFGWQERAPDPRLGEEECAFRAWRSALEILENSLRSKGIVT